MLTHSCSVHNKPPGPQTIFRQSKDTFGHTPKKFTGICKKTQKVCRIPENLRKQDGYNHFGVQLNQPKTIEERMAVAKTCATQLKYSMPLLVDTMDDTVGNLYSGMPARAYVIDTDGKVTYQGGRGPFGFRPAEMEQSLIMTLMK